MGVDINTYRCRVGMFIQGGGCGFVSLCITFGRVAKLLGSLTLIRILLFMAGIEQNPGPAERYIFCYQYLLIEIGTDVMRRIFDIRVGNDFGQYLSANQTENGKLQNMILAKIIAAYQIKNLPPIDNSPKSSNFDITLLSCLLRNVCGLRGRNNAVWKNQAPTDVSLEADLARLKECRNNLQHSRTVFISEADLKVKWNELSQILTRLNAVSRIPNLPALINAAEKMDIDEELQKRHDQAIKAWIKMENEIEELKLCYSELKRKVENIEQSHESTHKHLGMDEADFKNRLVKIYEENCRTLPVTPLSDADEVEVELLSIYEPPSLYHVPYHRTHKNEEKYSISSYEEMFRKNDRTLRKIYITGDAGVGKTSFCKRMSLLWCKSQSGESVDNESIQEDINFMANYDFVFYVSLVETHRKDVVTMIIEQLFSIEHDGKQSEMYDFIENILGKNECIIIMDAFDEWTPKERGKLNINKLSADKCKFVTTCRAYKIENERLSPRDIDRQVHMIGINLCSSKRYVTEIVNQINEENGDNKNPDDFIRDVKKCKLTAQLRIPIIASHLVVIWFDHKLTNMNKARVYSNIVDMLLKRAEKRKNIELPTFVESKVKFPDSLSEFFYLKKHSFILNKICLLSFNILFEQGKCFSDLVFTTEQLESEPYCVSAKEIDFLCKFGILSKTKVICKFGKLKQKLSFLHKSYLDYFAALFVFSFDSGNTFDEIVKKWNTINDVVKFENFFLFIVGFSSQKSEPLFKNIYDKISDDLSLCRRKALSYSEVLSYREKLKSLQAMVIKCLKEVSEFSDTILSFKLEDVFGKNLNSDTDNDGSFYDDDNYKDYNDDDNESDGYCPYDDDYENYNDDDNESDSNYPDDNGYESYNDVDHDSDGHYPDDNDYENYNDADHDIDDYCPDDNDYENYNDADHDSDGYCPDDNDYENQNDADHDSDGYCPDDNDYENYNDADNDSDGYCSHENDYENHNDADHDSDGYCPDNNDYANHNDADNDSDGYCCHENDYENHNDDDNDNDGHCSDDNNYDNYIDDDNDIGGYCPDDNDYENYNDDDNESDGYCPDDNDYENYNDDDNECDGYCPYDNDYENYNDDENESDGYYPDDNDYENYNDDDNNSDGYCLDDTDYENYYDADQDSDNYCPSDYDYENCNDDDSVSDGYCPDDNDYENNNDDNDSVGKCQDDNDYERHIDDDNYNDGLCSDVNDYENNNVILISRVIVLMMIIMKITEENNDEDGSCSDEELI